MTVDSLSFGGRSIVAGQLPRPPVPLGLRSGIVHTVVGGLSPRSWRARKCAATVLATERALVLDAGLGVRLTAFYTGGLSDTQVILIHGWEGSAQSAYVLSAASALHVAGHSVCRLQLRDHGDSHGLNEAPFLGSEHAEVIAAVAEVQRRFPATRTVVVGYSLGGNFAVRLAAFGRDAGLSLAHVVAVSPPINPRDAAHTISSSALFNRYFARRWKSSIRLKMQHFASWRAHAKLLEIDDIIAMHEAFVPRFTAFANADAYFASYALNAENLGQLSCSADLVLAADDPVCPVDSLRDVARIAGLTTTVVPHGGHCGFLEDWRMRSWLDRYLVHTVDGVAHCS